MPAADRKTPAGSREAEVYGSDSSPTGSSESSHDQGSQERPSEQSIYERMWEIPEYRAVAPGESCVHEFLKQARPEIGATVLDLGCGTGRASLLLALPPPIGGNFNVTMVDFAENCLDPDIRDMLATQSHALRFVKADLTKEVPANARYGFCTDVLEHIPTEFVNRVLNNCLMACQHVFFQISTVPDVMGGRVGHPLHLTVRPYEWWLQKFKDRECVIHWSRQTPNSCMFYVSAWTDGKTIQDTGTLNMADEKAKENVAFNVKQGWMQVEPYDTNNLELMILGGGPSLNGFEDEIKANRAAGMKLVTLNGTYNWALERGLKPSATVVVDGRAHNARFTKPVIDDCKYLICSQCDPAVLEGLPKDRTYLWHTGAQLHREILDATYEKKWYWIPGGSTVLLRAMPLLRLLGYRKFHLYGCDSCVNEESHHAYAQPENDGEILLPTMVTGSDRVFKTTVWQASQAHEFMDLMRLLGDIIEIQIHGDGLLAHILNTGATLEDTKKE